MASRLMLHVEALLFASDKPIGAPELLAVLRASGDSEITLEEIEAAIDALVAKYDTAGYAFHLSASNNGYQFLTDKAYFPLLNHLLAHRAKKKLSQATLETLAIVAYRQPVTRVEIEQIRGVNCDYTLQKLLEKELIGISGKSDGPGKPILYTTSELFMDYFGINSRDDLPRMKDIGATVNTVGEVNEGS